MAAAWVPRHRPTAPRPPLVPHGGTAGLCACAHGCAVQQHQGLQTLCGPDCHGCCGAVTGQVLTDLTSHSVWRYGLTGPGATDFDHSSSALELRCCCQPRMFGYELHLVVRACAVTHMCRHTHVPSLTCAITHMFICMCRRSSKQPAAAQQQGRAPLHVGVKSKVGIKVGPAQRRGRFAARVHEMGRRLPAGAG